MPEPSKLTSRNILYLDDDNDPFNESNLSVYSDIFILNLKLSQISLHAYKILKISGNLRQEKKSEPDSLKTKGMY